MYFNEKLIARERRALCGICPAGCWIVVTYNEEGRIDKVRPDESSGLGIICKLGEYSADIVYAKDRLLYPMRRKGPKGTYEFEKISWDQAYDTIVEKLNRIKADFGPEAAALYTGRGSFELSMCDIYQPKGVAVSSASSVLFPFGSPNTMGVGSLCYVSFAMIAPHITMGGMLINMFSDIENAGLIIVWGANPATDCPPLDLKRILNARERGAEVIVIDPRRTMTAKLTDAEWIPVRSGTDGALALGICNVLIKEERYDEAFVRDWTRGFDEFSRYVQHFSPEVVEDITGVPAEKIQSLARRISEAHGASPVMYSGLEYNDSGVQAIRAAHVLWALAGQLDVPGGRCFSMRENQFPLNRDGHIPNPDLHKTIGRNQFPVYSLYRSESHPMSLPDAVIRGKPYPIRSLIILGASLITAWPQPKIWRETLHALDFLVCIDRQLTADAAYADIVLPGTTMYEIESYMIYGPVFRIREKVVEPVGEARNDFFIMAELARRLGYGYLYPQNEEELLRHVLKASGFTLEDARANGGTIQVPTVMMQYKKWEKGLLRSDGRPGFDTPTGKFEIASTILEEHGYDPLPVYTEPREGPRSQPETNKRFPLIFNSGSRVTTDFRSQHHAIPGLYKERPEPTVTIHTQDARERDIKDGDRVTVQTARGQVPMRALVTDDIMQGTIDANMGGGGPLGPKAWQECNINELTDLKRYDPISGFPVYKALLCDVRKISEQKESVKIDSGEYGLYAELAVSEEEIKEKRRRIYFDHNATTPLDSEVFEVMTRSMGDCYGNPSSIYKEGKDASCILEASRRSIAQLINCTARRVLFTGSGSEANNLVLKGVAFWNIKGNKNHIITTQIEHPSVLATCEWLEKNGMRVTYLTVDRAGMVNPEDLAHAITEKTCLVSIMTANNETGTIQPVKEFARIAREHGALFHTDCVQGIGKIPIDVETLEVDFLSMSGHKIHGPKGAGALYIRNGASLEPLIHGGKQEYGLRAGTENLPGIAGFGKAAKIALKNLAQMDAVRNMRDRLEDGIRELLPGMILNGHRTERLPNTLNITLPGMRGESIVLTLDQNGVSISSGSACRSGSPKPSHVLIAMGLSEEEAHCSVRFSLGIENSGEEVETTLFLLRKVICDSKNIVRFIPCR
ncbi:MAG: Cysteine desulfurase [Candidatus Jettenia ecosi]|uniref:cysteine desulfurase n=1 Tax=Candidatus Jettenia ecosi TaxID=2494326 RepID=A0A533Q600_9BACT|nr:MAG: Cysteine desulfurase [Candidatus Jettenia ecosi]